MSASNERIELGESGEMYRVEYEKMLKGSIVMRRGKPIRQFGITMEGSTRLITSGDLVDRTTYEALIAAGVLAGTIKDKQRRPAAAEPLEGRAEQSPGAAGG